MRFFTRFPTYVILGFLSIYYLAIFSEFQPLLRRILSNTPLMIGYLLVFTLGILPIGLKTSAVYEYLPTPNRRKVLSQIVFFSAFVFIIFGTLLLSRTDLSILWKQLMSSDIMVEFHRPIIGFITLSVTYLIYFTISDQIKIEQFLESINALKWASPVFCFAAPAFWEEKLTTLNLPKKEISFLGGASFISGLAFMASILIFFIAKHLNESNVSPEDTIRRKTFLLKTSLGLFFLGLAILLMVCLDISYFISKT